MRRGTFDDPRVRAAYDRWRTAAPELEEHDDDCPCWRDSQADCTCDQEEHEPEWEYDDD